MAKKQTRRSISVSRTTYERLKAFCETSGISMSQFVEARVGESLSGEPEPAERDARDARDARDVRDVAPRPAQRPPQHQASPASTSASPPSQPRAAANPAPAPTRPTGATGVRAAPAPAPMTSVAARYAAEPPPPIIKPKQEQAAPAPIQPTADQIFTF